MALEYNLPLAQNDNEQCKFLMPSQGKRSKMKLKILQQNPWVKIIKGCIQIFEFSLRLDVGQYHEQKFYIKNITIDFFTTKLKTPITLFEDHYS